MDRLPNEIKLQLFTVIADRPLDEAIESISALSRVNRTYRAVYKRDAISLLNGLLLRETLHHHLYLAALLVGTPNGEAGMDSLDPLSAMSKVNLQEYEMGCLKEWYGQFDGQWLERENRHLYEYSPKKEDQKRRKWVPSREIRRQKLGELKIMRMWEESKEEDEEHEFFDRIHNEGLAADEDIEDFDFDEGEEEKERERVLSHAMLPTEGMLTRALQAHRTALHLANRCKEASVAYQDNPHLLFEDARWGFARISLQDSMKIWHGWLEDSSGWLRYAYDILITMRTNPTAYDYSYWGELSHCSWPYPIGFFMDDPDELLVSKFMLQNELREQIAGDWILGKVRKEVERNIEAIEDLLITIEYGDLSHELLEVLTHKDRAATLNSNHRLLDKRYNYKLLQKRRDCEFGWKYDNKYVQPSEGKPLHRTTDLEELITNQLLVFFDERYHEFYHECKAGDTLKSTRQEEEQKRKWAEERAVKVRDRKRALWFAMTDASEEEKTRVLLEWIETTLDGIYGAGRVGSFGVYRNNVKLPRSNFGSQFHNKWYELSEW